MTTYSLPGQLACTPLPPQEATSTKVVGGMARAAKKNELPVAQVVFPVKGDCRFAAGDTVRLHPESYAHAWAKNVLTVDGKEFILVPVDPFVFLVSQEE